MIKYILCTKRNEEKDMYGVLYGIGVGPGDPELMTLKAVRLIKENEVIAVPGSNPKGTVAYQIAVQSVPELEKKRLFPVHLPMTMDQKELDRSHEMAADQIEEVIKGGENVVFLTLGDPTVYSTYLYIQKKIIERGYKTEIVSGIPSFCAAAARANIALAEWNEKIHIIPARHYIEDGLKESGNYVLMKSGKKMKQIKQILRESSREIIMVENCGMQNERIYYGVDEIPNDAGYYSLIIAKEVE